MEAAKANASIALLLLLLLPTKGGAAKTDDLAAAEMAAGFPSAVAASRWR